MSCREIKTTNMMTATSTRNIKRAWHQRALTSTSPAKCQVTMLHFMVLRCWMPAGCKRECFSIWKHYLISLGGSPAVVSCTCRRVHGPLKQEGCNHRYSPEADWAINFDLCVCVRACVSLAPSPFPSVIRAHTHGRARAEDAQPVMTKIAALQKKKKIFFV